MNQLQIYKDAQRLFRQYGTRDPLEIIEAAPNIKLWLTDAFGENGLKGFSTLSNRTYYVAINSYLRIEEKRVVAGHELGHIFEHALQLRCQTMQDFDVYQAKGKLEREANFFAADLMLDDEKVLDLIYSGNTDFFDVAKELNIPAPFLGFKLYSLIGRGERLRLPIDMDSRFLRSRH